MYHIHRNSVRSNYILTLLKMTSKKNNITTEKELNNILVKHIKNANKTGFSKYYTHTYDILNYTVNKKCQSVIEKLI